MSASRLGRSGSGYVYTLLGDQIICIGILQNPLLVRLIGQFSTLPGRTFLLGKKNTEKNSPWDVKCMFHGDTKG